MDPDHSLSEFTAAVTRADVLHILVDHFPALIFQGMVHAQGNIGALAGDG